MEYMTTQETAKKWGVTQRRIQAMCEKGKIPTAERIGLLWVIPKGTPKPLDGRIRRRRNFNSQAVAATEEQLDNKKL